MAQGKKHIVTDELREEVAELSSNGITHEEIASILDINADCLARHYAKELKTARLIRVKKAGTRLFELAMAGDITALIFFLKTQGRWRTEDHAQSFDANENVKREIKELRASLDAKNRKDY